MWVGRGLSEFQYDVWNQTTVDFIESRIELAMYFSAYLDSWVPTKRQGG